MVPAALSIITTSYVGTQRTAALSVWGAIGAGGAGAGWPLVPPATWRLRSLASSPTVMLGVTAS